MTCLAEGDEVDQLTREAMMTEIQTPHPVSLYDIVEIELIGAQNIAFEPPLRLMFADANDVALMIRFDTIGDGAVSPRIVAAPPAGFGRLRFMAPAHLLFVDNRERVLSTVIEADGEVIVYPVAAGIAGD